MNLVEQTKIDVEKIIQSFEILTSQSEANEAEQNRLRDWESQIRQLEEYMATEKLKLKKAQGTLDEEKAFLVRMAAENKVKEASIVRGETKLKTDLDDYTEKLKQLAVNQKLLEDKRLGMGDLGVKEKALEEREAMLAKEKIFDRERKEFLDARERRIAEREEHLQKYADL